MIIYLSKLKNKIILTALCVFPIFLGLISNLLIFSGNERIDVHVTLFMIPFIQIVGAITSVFVFNGNKRIYTYIYCIIAIIYTEVVIIFGLLSNDTKFGPLSALTVIFYLFYLYGIYPFVVGMSKTFNAVKYRIRLLLNKLNIHLISEKMEHIIESEMINDKSSLSSIVNIKTELNSIDTEFSNVNSLLNDQIMKLSSKIKILENTFINLRKKASIEAERLADMRNDVLKLENVKKMSKDQIDMLFEKQNRNQAITITIGFALGIIGSLIANFVYTNINNILPTLNQ
jgi:hypothetical protein